MHRELDAGTLAPRDIARIFTGAIDWQRWLDAQDRAAKGGRR